MQIIKAGYQQNTCFLRKLQLPFDSRLLLQIFKKLTVCLTNLLSLDVGLSDESPLNLTVALFGVLKSLPSASFQVKYTYLCFEGT